MEATRRIGPKLTFKDKLKESLAELKETSWLERSVIGLSLLLLTLIVYYFVFVPGDADLEFQVVEKKAAIASGKTAAKNKSSEDVIAADPAKILAEIDERDKAMNQYHYDAVGKRDPFLPFDYSPKKEDDTSKTPLERYDLGQLKLTAILAGLDEARAIVETGNGKGFSVKIGTKMGRNNGVITHIDKEKIVVRESFVNFAGEEQIKDIEMRLRIKGTEEGN